jgi:hypothetical protein
MNILKKFKTDFVFWGILCILYFKYIPSWVSEWTNFDSFYSFFPFLIIFAFQFFKIKAEKFSQTKIQPTNWGLSVVLIALMAYFIGVKADIALLSGLSLPLLLSGTMLFLYGKKFFMLILPIIILFSLSIPVLPVFRLTVPLQIFLAQLATKALNLMDINAYKSINI